MRPVNPLGLRPAVESGLMADATLAVRRDDRRVQLQVYYSRLVARFAAAATPNAVGPAFLRNFLAGMLLDNKRFTRRVVLDRWLLHANRAAIQTA